MPVYEVNYYVKHKHWDVSPVAWGQFGELNVVTHIDGDYQPTYTVYVERYYAKSAIIAGMNMIEDEVIHG
jgi:hypothetical protein